MVNSVCFCRAGQTCHLDFVVLLHGSNSCLNGEMKKKYITRASKIYTQLKVQSVTRVWPGGPLGMRVLVIPLAFCYFYFRPSEWSPYFSDRLFFFSLRFCYV